MAKSGLGAPDLAAASPTPATSPHGLANSKPPSLPCTLVLRSSRPQGVLTLRLATPVHLHAPKERPHRRHHASRRASRRQGPAHRPRRRSTIVRLDDLLDHTARIPLSLAIMAFHAGTRVGLPPLMLHRAGNSNQIWCGGGGST